MLNITALIAALLTAVAVAGVGAIVVAYANSSGRRRSLAMALRIGSIRPADPSMATDTGPNPLAAGWQWMSQRLVVDANREQLGRHLAWAGRASARDLEKAVSSKVAYATVGVLLALFMWLRWGTLGLVAGVPIVVAAYFVPDVLIYNSGLKRTEEIALTLPDALDLLDLCVESGLSLQAALARVANSQQGPVSAEFARVLKEMQLGVSRADAFEALGRRTTQPDLQRFVAAVQQVDRLGIPVATVLTEQATEMRAKRHARAREQAQKVPVKILAPLMLCFLPGLFIIILGPAVVNAVNFFAR